MKRINNTGLGFAWLPGKIDYPADSLTLVAKGAFRLEPGAVATPLEDDSEFAAEAYEDDQPGRGCLYDGDFAYFKPRADVVVLGTCHTPGGKPLAVCRVAFQVGSHRKSLAIYGDYSRTSGLLSEKVSDPVPFTTMPLHYRNSYGGEGFPANPIGKGFAKVTDDKGRESWPLPNLQAEGRPLTSSKQQPEPVGFGPLDRTWAQRVQGMGTYDTRWEEQRWPWFPEDFDWGCLNAAPRDQQIEGYLRGDEPLSFENMHPEHSTYHSRLPGVRVRCLLREQGREGEPGALREVPMRLDTVWIDLDEARLVLVWRGHTPIRSPKYEELAAALLVAEDLQSPARPVEDYRPQFEDEAEETEARTLAAPASAAGDAAEPEPPDLAAIEADVKKEVAAELDAMRLRNPGSLRELDRVKHVVLADDPDRELDALITELGVDLSRHDQALAADHKRVAGLLERLGHDPSILEEPEKPPPSVEAPPTRADLESRTSAGESLAGADLTGIDLGGADLRGANLEGAILSGANLAGADLTEANLTGAVLDKADLSEATLVAAKLDQADLSRATLVRSNLERATLNDAFLNRANLSGANLAQAQVSGARITDADLTETRLSGACLDVADFSGSRLDGAILDEASMVRATLGNATGVRVSMVGADLTELRGGDGCVFPEARFKRSRADGSLWTQADLRGADFSESDLVRADFSGAELAGADLSATELRHADLSGARLTSAKLVRANLFQARLKEADLTNADLSGSNCFQAEFWDAVTEGTVFSGANLKRTKLAGDASQEG